MKQLLRFVLSVAVACPLGALDANAVLAQRCNGPTSWSPLVPVAERPIRYASVLPGPRGSIQLVGDEFPRFIPDPRPDSIFAVAASGVAPLPVPRWAGEVLYPRLHAMRDSSIVMIWGRRDSADTAAFEWGTTLGELWAARWTEKDGWGAPARILKGTAIQWHEGLSEAGRVLPDGSLVLAVATVGGITAMRYDSTGWSSRRIARGPFGNASLVTSDDGAEQVVAFTGLDTAVASDINSVWAMRSHDSGRTWSPPEVVNHSDGIPAFDLAIRRGPDGVIHLVWLRSTEEATPVKVARHVQSVDKGAHWSAPSDLKLPSIANFLQIAVDRCGRLHLAYEELAVGDSHARMAHARWWKGRWSPIQHPWPGLDLFHDALVVDGAGNPLMLVLQLRDLTNNMPSFRLMASRLEPTAHRR